MRNSLSIVGRVTLGVAVAVALGGCSGKTEPKTPPAKSASAKKTDSHDHKSGDGHDHDDHKTEAKTAPTAKTEPTKTPDMKTPEPKTEPAKTPEPKTEPTKTPEPKTPDMKTPEPKTEPAKTEPAKTEAAKTEPAKTAAKKVLLGSAELFAGIPGEGKLTVEQIKAWLDNPASLEPLDFDLPLGLDRGRAQVKGLDKNALTRAKIELGRQLYFDTRLSKDNTISCASCHDPNEGFARHTRFGEGIAGADGKPQTGNRNSPVSYNRILSDKQFWDGRAGSLEEQAVGPIQNPIEMGNTHENCVATLAAIPGYKLQFEKVFGGAVTIDMVGQAIASFERAVVTGPSPYDYYEPILALKKQNIDPEDLKDDSPEQYAAYQEALKLSQAHPMSESAIRGRELFFTNKANCTACHVGPNLTDELYHNLGVGADQPMADAGRGAISKDAKETGAFKTPTIRNVALSAPYMHDGSQKTLEEVVEWYAKGGHPNPHLSDKVKKLELSDQDKKDLVEFMKACTGEFPKIERGRLPE